MQNSKKNIDGDLNISEFGAKNKTLIAKLMYKVLNCKKCRQTAVIIGNIHKEEIKSKKISQQTHTMSGNQLWNRLCPDCKGYSKELLHKVAEKYEEV